MSEIATSIIIVSRGRPRALARCLLGVSQLNYQNFEVIVVADVAGLDALAELPFADKIKTAHFDEENISVARNLGLSLASGRVVAFIDDDSVPEPSWLSRLVEPFQDQEVVAAGGYVRGRNGISFQWRAASVDSAGRTRPLQVQGRNPMAFSPPECRAVKTEGTNCAFRRKILAQLGGFDPLFTFYLDEVDVNMRLAIEGHSTAIVPLAQVHHGYFASSRRNSARAPKTLRDIGRSLAIFHRKYADPVDAQMAWRVELIDQKKRLLKLMLIGSLEPRDVTRLMQSLIKGYAEGLAVKLIEPPEIAQSETEFQPFETLPYSHKTLVGRIWQKKKLRNDALKLVAKGYRVTLILMSPTMVFHRVVYKNKGYWEQIGGLFGKSSRDQPLFQFYTFKSRVNDEISRSDLFRSSK